MTILQKIESVFDEEKEIPAEFDLKEPVDQTEYLIRGELRQWNGPVKTVYSPVCRKSSQGCSQKVIGSFPLFSEKESLEALDSAVSAYDNGRGFWPTLSVEGRIKHIQAFTLGIKTKRSEVIRLLSWETGKSIRDSEKEFDRTVDYILNTIEAVKDLDRVSSRFVIEQGIIGQIRRSPLGVVLCMGPYNYPLNETFTTLIPALIMGNTVVFKPPRVGVLLYRPLLEVFRDSFPPGVVNSVYGQGHKIISPLVAAGKIDVLAFIGTSKVADVLRKQHPRPHRLRCVLGLDAKNAAIVLPDADLELAVKECISGALSFNGQRCTAIKIIFVHSGIAEKFNELLCRAIADLKMGLPWENGVEITPLPDPDKIEYLKGLVEDARAQGAGVINEEGGTSNLTFFYPAVLFPVNSKMRVYYEEQFGPVIPVVSFDSIEEPVRYIVESNYGQQVSIFGNSPNDLAGLIDPLVNQVCRVNLNSQCQRSPDSFPFNGRKDSAEGTLSVSDALRAFSIRTIVAARNSDRNQELITRITRERMSNFLSTDFIF